MKLDCCGITPYIQVCIGNQQGQSSACSWSVLDFPVALVQEAQKAVNAKCCNLVREWKCQGPCNASSKPPFLPRSSCEICSAARSGHARNLMGFVSVRFCCVDNS